MPITNGDERFAFEAPPLRFLGLEPLRAALEFAGHHLMPARDFPPGDGHPVVVFPGLASDSHATAPLRRFCEKLGYEVHDWGRGFNVGPPGDFGLWLDDLAEEIAALVSANGKRASLIGWSLGGLYAREVAKLLPRRVQRVITIGTPLGSEPSQTHASLAYRLLNGQAPPEDAALNARLRQAPAVPTTSIYSRSDGIVAWQACLQDDGPKSADNVEVSGSHCGMGWNPEVLAIVAERLARKRAEPGRRDARDAMSS
jgi:pimeloyl-ACP methyl ester carboxylesterase